MKPKFLIGGGMILAAVFYLIFSATTASAERFMTVDEMLAETPEIVGDSLRITGAVIGDTIQYDPDTLTLTFEIAHAPADFKEIEEQGGLAKVLYDAVHDPTRARVKVIYIGVKPDLLRTEAQAIMTGTLDENGVFHATELLLKCPTRYEQALPEQTTQP
ncbi:MAG: cytochrome c maturation protein CcmE [Anaerolineales bacterium]|nr:cytochrome c maturation protein CcmE [Anaerolineales bacterium]